MAQAGRAEAPSSLSALTRRSSGGSSSPFPPYCCGRSRGWFFLDNIREGVLNNSPSSRISGTLSPGGDARYLNGDPLIVVLEAIAVFVGLFEGYALFKFFQQGRRFTNAQLSFIMAGMIVEVTLPMVYFGVEIMNRMTNTGSGLETIVTFVLLIHFGARSR
ncbi:hypothetical protein AB5I41_14950 [Sphingomonas sp. MMS24-JH45]